MELNDILLLLEKFEASDLTTLSVKLKGDEFTAGRHQSAEEVQGGADHQGKKRRSTAKEKTEEMKEHTSMEESAEEEASASEEHYQKILSPIVGTFYSRPSEKEEPYVKVGQKVKKGDVLCILEAMKIMNEIKSSHDGTIRKILVSDGDMADFGKVLFLLEEA